MNPIAEDILKHYGMPKRSGRYPWGSGENPFQRSGDFLSRVDELRKENFTFTDDDGKTWKGDMAIAKSMGLDSTQFRTQVSLANAERRSLQVDTAKGLREKGYSLNEIAEKMGYKNDSSVRSLLNENSEARMNQAKKVADFLKEQVDTKGMIDVGVGVERELGNISREKMKQALYILEMEGYELYGGGVPQVTNPGKQTNIQVLCPPGTEHKEIYNLENVHSLRDYISHDGGDTFDTFVYPKSMDSNRIKIRYAEEGGNDKDGVVEIRRGVDDLSLGNSHYAQVRILVDDNKYIKGMAVYSDNMPDGVDAIFNTNKKQGTPKGDVLKNIEKDPDNPFGSLIKAGGQSYYIDKDGKRQLSLINKRAEEGDWDEWSKNLPSQFLSKQSKTLIEKQLNLASADKQAEFDEIMSLPNPTLKKVLLKKFSDDCDSAAIHLQAAALPRQRYQVILPITSMKDNEVYAPNFEPGEQVALIRFPHGGTFEIPILTVNNKQAEARRILGNTPADAIGINSKVANRLSGADFDGDTVMVIPTGGKVKITSTRMDPKHGLDDFDPKMSYGTVKKGDQYYNSHGKKIKVMSNTQTEMGKASNLITDMTLRGATQDELAKAVRHSMVVIDAEKHKLDYKQSEIDNNITSLKKKYQGSYDKEGRYREGAATLISRAKSQEPRLKVTGSPKINTKDKAWYDPTRPEGALLYNRVANKADKDWYDPTLPKSAYVYKPAETYVDKTGKVKTRTQQSTKMAETDDAFTLVSDANTPAERVYAEYANRMKALGNQARKEMVTAGNIEYSSSAKKVYQEEVDHLMSQLNVALKNAPRERQAQLMANAAINAKKQANPDITRNEIKKLGQQELTKARAIVGAKRLPVTISDREWEAIQAGAISENRLTQILNNVDIDDLRQRATPRTTNSLSTAKINRIASMKASGYTTKDIANALGVSSTTVLKYLKGKE
jgi:predicted transcriptional regulator